MTKGRKPKPTALKLVTGNPGRRPLNKSEPQPDAAIPECPAHLDEEARREWNRVAEQLHRIGVLTEIDRPALAAYCQAWSRWIEAEANVRQYGAVLITKDKGYPMQSPYLSISNEAVKTMRSFLTEFGMTPSSRSRVHASKTAAGVNPQSDLESFVRNKHA